MAEENALIQVNRRAMEFIWSRCPKENIDGVDYVVYVETDIPALYYSGLVDTERFKLKHWQQAFEDCRREDGKYYVNHEKMIFLGMFRFCKKVGEPFDPLKMRTGKYSVDRFWQLFENSIIPSTSLDKAFLKHIFDGIVYRNKSAGDLFGQEIKAIHEKGEELEVEDKKLKNKFTLTTDEKGVKYIDVSEGTLEGLKNLIDTYPSPRRKMELGVQELRMGKLQQLANQAQESQKSTFEAGKDFRDVAKKDLKDMLVKASEKRLSGRKPSGEVLDLKNLQKKNRPTKY